MLLSDPSSIDLQVDFDSTVSYSVYERIGDVNFRPVTTMSFDEYDTYNDSQLTKEYFKERSSGLDGESAVSGRSLIPRLYISPVFDRLFGGSYVDIQPNGFVNLDFGGRFQRVDNPAIPRRQQRNGGFNFNQQISLNLVGKVGEKLAITANFDNNNTFDFQNNMKVEYTGYEEDIVKKIEVGNVSMPVSNSLMTGAQSLFGFKTQLQFGKLFITGVVSRQQGKSEVLTIESGFQGKEFEVRASNYDENRHFFLGHFFRENYERWHNNLPQITSGLNITRVEVYVINRNNDTRTTREVVGLMDLGETNRANPQKVGGIKNGVLPTNNQNNDLFSTLVGGTRSSSEITGVLEGQGLVNSLDFVKVGTARRLEDDEYIVNRQLGYVSLLRRLQNDEMLAVSFEYTYNGQPYSTGELTEDYSGLSEDQVIFLKLLRPNKINTQAATWDLMMKNIYNLNASQINRDGFTLRIRYRDDATGIDNPSIHEGSIADRPLIELLGLDQLNQNNDQQRDGNFDYVEGITIDSRNGNILFPVLEPFGSTLRSKFNPNELAFIEKYVYDTLYQTTRADAEQVASKNKYFITGRFNAGSSSEIALPGINIAENSVVVTAGNTPLTEGLDYTVDYNLGRVRILNDGIMNSGKTINISYEKADLFNFQSRWLYGTRLDYQFNDRFNVGATLLHLNERPGGISRYTIGDEPTRNTKYGFDINFQDEVPFLTKVMDFLPLVSTKAPSSISFNAEFAQMIPGTSNLVDGEGTSYIDDFEQAITPQNIGGWPSWKLASTPKTTNNRFQGDGLRAANNKRGKLAWYTVDRSVFYVNQGSDRPDNISVDDLSNHYVRPIQQQEIFRERNQNIINNPEQIFDIAYYPSERGQYNYSQDLQVVNDEEGNPVAIMNNPEDNFGGITQSITTDVDFDKTNIEYLEFWMLDPFIEGPNGIVRDGVFNTNNTTGGELIFNLGSVSEDVIPDGRHGFESGFPGNGDPTGYLEDPEWGRVPSEPFLTNNFERTQQALSNQDIGLDGLSNEDEVTFFQDYINSLPAQARNLVAQDPSADDFDYYLGEDLDAGNVKILERYKNYNGMENNSPLTGTQASTTIPDNEDLNKDNTISDQEEYYEYRLPLRPGQLEVGTNNIVDQITDQSGDATWYLFRIPIRDPDNIYGGIDGYKTIRYLRMYLTNFRQPVVLRMAQMQLVGSQWRKYQEALNERGLNEIPEQKFSDFDVSVVGIEENSTGATNKIGYVVPPGINRDRDNTTLLNRQVNEQSLQICVDDLQDKDSRAVFKNVTYDLINYGRLKMFLHGEARSNDMVLDDEVTAFLRVGTDFTENFYEIEVPLKITQFGATSAREIWPLENEIDISINELLGLKSERNRLELDNLVPYSRFSSNGQYQLTVKGRPDISSIQVLMIGLRNPESDDRAPKSVCLWANELRVTEFDKRKGWAANARLSTKLADVATVNASTRYTSIGFGNIQQTIQQRTRRETLQYDLSANVNVDKFLLPEKTGLKVPMFVSYEKSRSTPQFDPLDPDVPLQASLNSINDLVERERYRKIVEDRTERRSLNFTNVRKEKVNPDANKHFFDIENLSFSYAFSDIVTSNVNTETYLQKSTSAGVGYNYSPKPLVLEPFANVDAFKSPYLKLVKDINLSLVPNSLSFRGDLNRNFRKTQLYDENLTINDDLLYYERLFTFNRNYSLRWNLTKSLNIDYSARANAVIDEIESGDTLAGITTPIEGDLNTSEERQYIWEQIKGLGRMKNFTQDVSATYRTPLDKLPITDWISADIRYAAGYTWTAGGLNQLDSDSVFFGHTIENRRDQGLSGKIDMLKLYNKVGYLKQINSPRRSRGGKDEEESNVGSAIFNGLLRGLMALRSINFTYNIRESTTLAGFKNTPFLFGLDSGWNAPGWKFLLGDQDPEIRFRARDNDWLSRSAELTTPFQQSRNTDLTLRALIEPANDLKLQLDAKRTISSTYQEIFRFVPDTTSASAGGFQSLTPARFGSYSISFLSIRTAFDEKGPNNTSDAFDQFRENIGTIQDRQNRLNTENGRYDSLSQDVLIPSFLAAYSGQSAAEAKLSPFPIIPIPNWRLDFNGLSKLPGLSDVFSSITISHGYRSIYNVNNYTNSLEYSNNLTLDNNILDYPMATVTTDSASGRFIPVYLINQVTISEQFAPLIGINLRTKNNLSTRIEYKKERNLSLNMANAQITETSSNDLTLDFGFSKQDFKLPFKFQGRTITLENDVTFRMSMTIRDSETIQRKLEGESKVTNGNTNFQLRPSMTYKINDQLDLTMYFERSVTEPKVSSFKTATTAFGTQLRFSLAQ